MVDDVEIDYWKRMTFSNLLPSSIPVGNRNCNWTELAFLSILSNPTDPTVKVFFQQPLVGFVPNSKLELSENPQGDLWKKIVSWWKTGKVSKHCLQSDPLGRLKFCKQPSYPLEDLWSKLNYSWAKKTYFTNQTQLNLTCPELGTAQLSPSFFLFFFSKTTLFLWV